MFCFASTSKQNEYSQWPQWLKILERRMIWTNIFILCNRLGRNYTFRRFSLCNWLELMMTKRCQANSGGKTTIPTTESQKSNCKDSESRNILVYYRNFKKSKWLWLKKYFWSLHMKIHYQYVAHLNWVLK